jgi:sulfite exporter TauE/SafE
VNLSAVLLTGLFAGGVSCAAVQGGLLTGLVTRQRGDATTQPAARVAARDGAMRGGQSKRPGKRSPQLAGADATGGPRTTAGKKPTDKASRGGMPRPLVSRIADDLAPVGGFLAGKLVAYTALGALLGAVGSVVQLSVGLRAAVQLAAGVLVIVFGLAQLGVRGFRRLTVQPPASWARFVRGQARSRSALAPTVLGLCTVLIPCGVTLSVEALALTAGSAWAGAATMAVFVLGTSPLFALLGYAARAAARVWQGRLATATGLLVLAMGVYTLNGGLTLLDSPLAASNLAQTLGFGPPPATAATVSTDAAGRQTAVLTASPGSYSPANIALKAGVPTTLVVRSQGNDGCTRAFVINGQQQVLPVDGDTPIDLGVLKPGTVRYRCAMGMYSGLLTITE